MKHFVHDCVEEVVISYRVSLDYTCRRDLKFLVSKLLAYTYLSLQALYWVQCILFSQYLHYI